MLLVVPSILSLASVASAAPWSVDAGIMDEPPHIIKESILSPRSWVKLGPAPSDHILSLRIALPQPNFPLLERHLLEVSEPSHERYGNHLSKEDVDALVAPLPESVDEVAMWLLGHGVAKDKARYSDAKDVVRIEIPVGLAEKMLNTKYHVWQHSEDGDVLIRTTSYSLPAALHRHVTLIQPTTIFSRTRLQRSHISIMENVFDAASLEALASSTEKADCNAIVTVGCLKELYNATGYVPTATNGNKIGITGYANQSFNLGDLRTFYQEQRMDAVGSEENIDVVLVNGGDNKQTLEDAGAEADLDTQFAFGISYPTPQTFYSTGGLPSQFFSSEHTPSNTNEPYSEWMDYVLNLPDPPQVISTSYGDDEQTVPESYAKHICNGFAQLGARGVSLIFSSGDYGVGDGVSNPDKQTCMTNDGTNRTRFIPVFPASCPFVTSVGATHHVEPEVAVSRFFSGGGFSDYFPRPSYQNEKVGAYMETIPEGAYSGLYNPAGRAIPDVSAQGDNFQIIFQSLPALIGGTSASAPVFAAFVSMLNDARLNAGLGPLGFLNPMLYTKGVDGLVEGQGGFNDVVHGHNAGCGTRGFNATKGYDPVTGLGTPNFGRLKDIVLSL